MSYEIFYYKYIYIDLDTSEGIEIPDKKKVLLEKLESKIFSKQNVKREKTKQKINKLNNKKQEPQPFFSSSSLLSCTTTNIFSLVARF
jgi:membrane-anchored protein YejM (alkaline phosphatase superfamily)